MFMDRSFQIERSHFGQSQPALSKRQAERWNRRHTLSPGTSRGSGFVHRPNPVVCAGVTEGPTGVEIGYSLELRRLPAVRAWPTFKFPNPTLDFALIDRLART
ncbi:hypothetical protein, partial [Rhodoblastus sp.]|uniref:hypothetical protein n=1 Tax=Rhodoblastus sp. TaxID=1962975 RepID=UPI003F9E6474